jgi:glycerol uptake facilitator-like aquaporin
MSLFRRTAAEGFGTALLLAIVVGSGIMGEKLSDGNAGIALLANSLATGSGLLVLILALGPVSGAHLNPLVTLGDAASGRTRWPEVPMIISAQLVGAFAGVAIAHTMFELPLFSQSEHARAGFPQAFSEFVATFGLLTVIGCCSASRKAAIPYAVAAYITAAYWFTASTSFANPAVTLARAATNTFSGIRPLDVPAFLVAQFVGAGAGKALGGWLFPSPVHAKGAVLADGTRGT